MKHTKTCPKCGSRNIVRFDGESGTNGTGNLLKTGITILSVVCINRYVCCNCGFTEEWIDTSELNEIESSFLAKEV